MHGIPETKGLTREEVAQPWMRLEVESNLVGLRAPLDFGIYGYERQLELVQSMKVSAGRIRNDEQGNVLNA